jgi:alanine-synthesizing transaminase
MFATRTNWNLATNRLSEALAKHRSAGKPLLDLTVSNPTECGFHYNDEAILGALRHPGALRYEPDARGLASARKAVMEYYAEKGVTVALEDLFLTTSTSEAYSFVFRLLCDPGDEVLIPAPSYPLFDFLADIQDVKLVRYPLIYDYGWQIDFHALRETVTPRSRAIIVVHPNNPTGHYAKTAEIEQLNIICAKYGLAIIADEVFFDFALDETLHTSFAENPSTLTFTLSGLSKICGLPQMKVAWLAVSGPQPSKMEALARLEVIADTYLSINTPVQLAFPAFFSERYSFQKQLLTRVVRNLAGLDRLLAAQAVCSRLSVEGGWHGILRVPAIQSTDELAVQLLETKGVLIHPGHYYELPIQGHLVASLLVDESAFLCGVRDAIEFFSSGTLPG